MLVANFVLSDSSESNPYAQLPITTKIEQMINHPLKSVRRVPGPFQYGLCHTHTISTHGSCDHEHGSCDHEHGVIKEKLK